MNFQQHKLKTQNDLNNQNVHYAYQFVPNQLELKNQKNFALELNPIRNVQEVHDPGTKLLNQGLLNNPNRHLINYQGLTNQNCHILHYHQDYQQIDESTEKKIAFEHIPP